MKTITKAVIFSGLAFLVSFTFFVGISVFGIFSLDHHLEKQMKAGQKYMDSLTDKDIQVWIQRTQKYLQDDPTTNTMHWDVKPVPPELERLKIMNIEVLSNDVNYVWAGGLDHTALHVRRVTNGIFQLTAEYNDDSNRVIWPKQ